MYKKGSAVGRGALQPVLSSRVRSVCRWPKRQRKLIGRSGTDPLAVELLETGGKERPNIERRLIRIIMIIKVISSKCVNALWLIFEIRRNNDRHRIYARK
jgi:hypothetical protein